MKGFKYACFSVLSLALLSACSMNQSSESSMDNQPKMNTTTNKNPLVGKDASNFELKDMKGNTVKLSDYKGKKLYLKFWATWCGPCRQSMPELEKLVKDTDRDFEILTIMAPGLQGEKTEEEFVEEYKTWAKEKRYHPNANKAKTIYKIAEDSISTQPSHNSKLETNIREGINLIKQINQILNRILSQMIEISEPLEEYKEAKKFSGISEKLAVQIVAEFGDLSKFKNKKSLISFIGIDAPPYESGNFKADQRKISKRGNAILRKVGYQAMKCMMSAKNPENEIYKYMIKKEKEGKAKTFANLQA